MRVITDERQNSDRVGGVEGSAGPDPMRCKHCGADITGLIAGLRREVAQAKLEAKVAKALLASEVSLKGVVKRLLRRRAQPAADFHEPDYQRYIQRRLEHLESLRLGIWGKTVLEVGAGIGELTNFFLDRECEVMATEVRPESLAMLRDRYPAVEVRELNLDAPPEGTLGKFDIVFCYGVLYHLKDPAAAIAYVARQTRGMLLLETRVSYGAEPAMNPYPEISDSPTQSATGMGCRPTRQWIFDRLKECLPYVYMPVTQPHRAHFPLEWATIPEEDVLANAVFIGSQRRIENEMLVNYVPEKQWRMPPGRSSARAL